MLILGTTMPDSIDPATAMASLKRWRTTNDDEEEDKLSYVPLPYLLSSLSCPCCLRHIVILLSHIIRFAGNGGSGGVGTLVPKGVAITGVAAGHCADVVITVVTVGPSGRWGKGDGATPGGVMALGDGHFAPLLPPAARPPAWAQESGAAAPAARRHDGHPPPHPPPPRPRWGRTKGWRAQRGVAIGGRSRPPHN
jgi:hypothetical protein